MPNSQKILNEAVSRFQRGEFGQAVEGFRLALKHQPKNASLHYNFGSALQAAGMLPAAIEAYSRAVALDLENDRFRRAWCIALRRVGRGEESVMEWRHAIEQRPQALTPRLELARSLLAMRRASEAVAAYRSALDVDPSSIEAMSECARVLLRIGDRAQSRAMAQRALQVDPAARDAEVLLARMEAQEGYADAARARLDRIMNTEGDARARGQASLELATILERRGEYDRAFEIVEHGQAALLSRLTAAERDPRPSELVMRLCREHITASAVAAWKPPPLDSRRDPVFIVGFPRTGTTLLEQMLSAHPNLVVTDELPLVQHVKDATIDRLKMRQPYPQSLHVLSARQLGILRDAYFEHAERIVGDSVRKKRLVDKSPLNTVDLCIVRRIFPEAPVIIALRDPRDTVLSAFFQAFARGMPHFYGFESTARLYAMMMSLWLYYRGVLGIQALELRYEDVVLDPEGRAKAMIEFVGEPWDDAVLQFHAPGHRRYVTTPSFDDVARPVYATSVKRWERYRAQFERVRETLEPFVREFGYGAW